MSQSILIADDSSAVRWVVHSYLAQRGFEVCGEAADGEDAMEKARALRPDLVLLDVAMPRTNGIEVASVLKHMMPGVRIVLFTIRRQFVSVDGADAMVDKAEGMGTLVECVQGLLAKSKESHASREGTN